MEAQLKRERALDKQLKENTLGHSPYPSYDSVKNPPHVLKVQPFPLVTEKISEKPASIKANIVYFPAVNSHQTAASNKNLVNSGAPGVNQKNKSKYNEQEEMNSLIGKPTLIHYAGGYKKVANLGCSKDLEKSFKKSQSEGAKSCEYTVNKYSKNTMKYKLMESLIRIKREHKSYLKQPENEPEGYSLYTRESMKILFDYYKCHRAERKKLKRVANQASELIKEANVIFSFEKLYSDLTTLGHYHTIPNKSLHYLEFRHFSEPKTLDEIQPHHDRYVNIENGDGCNTEYYLTCNINYKVIQGIKSFNSWKFEKFKPAICIPDLRFVYKVASYDSIYSYFNNYLLTGLANKDKIVVDHKHTKKLSEFYFFYGNYKTIGDYIRFIPTVTQKIIIKREVMVGLEEYNSLATRYKSTKDETFFKSLIRNEEDVITSKLNVIIESAVLGLLESFFELSDWTTIGHRNEDMSFVKMNQFYMKCPILNIGKFVLKLISGLELFKSVGLDKAKDVFPLIIFQQFGEELSSKYKLKRLQNVTLIFLKFVLSFADSVHLYKYFYRRLLFWINNIRVDGVLECQIEKRIYCKVVDQLVVQAVKDNVIFALAQDQELVQLLRTKQ